MTERTSELPPDEPDEAPEGFREQPRYASAVERAYANDRIEVTWNLRSVSMPPNACAGSPPCSTISAGRGSSWTTDRPATSAR